MAVRDWLAERFNAIKRLPKSLQLRFFAATVLKVIDVARCAGISARPPRWWRPQMSSCLQPPLPSSPTLCAASEHAISLMSSFVRRGGKFVQSLALTSVQLFGLVASASLNPFRPEPSMAAGLPHFATHHMRCWGRDTCIGTWAGLLRPCQIGVALTGPSPSLLSLGSDTAVRGLYMVTGRFDEARALLTAFASCVRHGLVPNLLDRYGALVPGWCALGCWANPVPRVISALFGHSGRFARFNCRDAVWWWLQAVQEYVKLSPEGVDFLSVSVVRYFPSDNVADPTADGEACVHTLGGSQAWQ